MADAKSAFPDEQSYEHEDAYDPKDAAHPFTKHSEIPSGQSFIFQQVDTARGNVTIAPSSSPDQPLYQIENTVSIDRSKPKLVLLSGGNPIVHLYHHWRTGYKIGVDRNGSGDESAMQWVKLERNGWTALSKSYSFTWQGKEYVLGRMREEDLGVTGDKKWLRHYKVAEKDSGEVVATYLTEEAFGKRTGVLVLAQGLDEDLNAIITTAIAEWREAARRQQRTVGATI